ncbi:MAG: hypothetical protein IGR92_02650 [Leptolyngbyaceae cyanobacterium T60_A2020_046]|nr:hypothetical protein [Leptolyngbyaceae cyanobacterium T60_A2020_046]
MNTNQLNRSLLTIVGLGWVAFAIAAFIIRAVFAAPVVTVLVDRSYCEPGQWQQVAEDYAALYERDRQGEIVLDAVVLFSDLGTEVIDEPPTPDTIRTLQTYGRPNPQRRSELAAEYPDAQLLTCP